MIARTLQPVLAARARTYPVVTVIGPRQAGKTTLVRATFPEHRYVNLERPSDREFANRDPEGFFRSFPAPLILDEIQRVPELLSWIQVMVDEGVEPGSFILTGSNQPEVGAGVAQSLAGRTSIVKLLPLSIDELVRHGIDQDRDEYLFRGFLPRVYQDAEPPAAAYQDYLATYVERDVRQIANLRNLSTFETFLRLLAGRTGQIVNLHSMAGDIGVSSTTLSQWLSILEASFIVFRLTPWSRDIGKRLVKRPKIYFLEPGLLAALLQIEDISQVSRDPLLGGMFENVVVVELLKAQWNRGLKETLSFYRDSSGREVDVILERQRRPCPIEVKAARTFSPDLARTLHEFQTLVPDSSEPHVIYGGLETYDATGFRAIPFTRTAGVSD